MTPNMKAEAVRFMWLFVFFDLPVGSKIQRREAGRFRKHLQKDGFIMLQFSVYARVCRGDDGVEKHLSRVRTSLPAEGSVRALQVTDRQYGRMRLMLGASNKSEDAGSRQMVLL